METPPSQASSPESRTTSSKSKRIFEPYQPIQVSLIDEANLWSQFSKLGTEMVVTRNGRQMFPGIKLRIENLSPYKFYKLYMELAPIDGMRYRYDRNTWSPRGTSENTVTSAWIEHPYSPAEGFKWMQTPVDFHVKLTNCWNSKDEDTAYLRSMYKYMIIIHVEEGSNMTQRNPELTRTFPLIKTTFIAVTTYQNHEVKELKTATNIHAKGIRQKKIKRFQEIYKTETGGFPKVENGSEIGSAKRLRLEPNACINSNGSYFARNATATREIFPSSSVLTNWNDIYPKLPNFCSKNDQFATDIVPSYHRNEASSNERIPVTAPLTVHCPSPYVPWDHPPYFNPFAFPPYPYPKSFQLYPPIPTPTLYPSNMPLFQSSCKSDMCRCTSLNICLSCKDNFQNCVTCNDSRNIQMISSSLPSSTTESDISSTFESSYSGHPSTLLLTDCTVSSVSDKNVSEIPTETNDVSSSIAEAISLQISD